MNGDAELKEHAESVQSILQSLGFSRIYFDTIQSASVSGIGYARSKKVGICTEAFDYNLEYTKTGKGIIRSKYEKRKAFEHVYNQAIKYIEEA